MWKFIFLIFCILLEPIASRRGGGFGGRGSSGSRGSSGTFGGNSGGFQSGGHVGAPSGGFNQPKAGGGFGGGGFGGAPARSSFSSHGSGMGSPSSGGAFKSALAGAAIGGLAGVAVGGLIAHATSPFSYGGHSYYWGPEYYKSSSGQFMCSMPLNDLIKNTPTVTTTAAPGANGTTVSDPNNVLQNLRFENGSKPHSIVWSCKTGTEVCCGTECCPNPQASSGSTGSSIAGIIIGVLIAILLISCCCCFLAYKLCREAFERFLPTRTQNYEDKYDDYSQPQQSYPQSGGYPNQSYPMQPYPSQQAQPSYGYPPQPQSYTPNAYPQYPHEQKY